MIQILLLCGGLILLPLVLEKMFKKSHGRIDLLLVAAFICLAAIFITDLFPRDHRVANFALHFFGGGLPVAFVFFYLRRHFGKLSNLQELVLLYFLVSGIGVLSELLEFLLDQATGVAYSPDRWDTWYDLLANSLGVLLGWCLYKIILLNKTIRARFQ